MSWFLFALLSVLAMAGSEITQKVALTRKINISAITNNAYIWLIQGVGGFVIALLIGQFELLSGWESWLKLIVLAFLYFVGGTAYYTSYKSNSPSVSIVLGSISVLISTAIGIALFNESTSWIKFVGIGLILMSIFVINFKKNKFKIDKYNALALLGGSLFGIAFSIDKSFVIDLNPFAYLGFMSVSVGVLSFFLKPKHIINETKRLHRVDFVPMFVIATFGIMFNLFSFLSYSKGGNVGAVDAINNTAVFFVIIAEVLLLNDRGDLLRKVVAAVIAISGIGLLSLI